jgi:hypothetical protein
VEPVSDLDLRVAQPFRQCPQGDGINDVAAFDRHDLAAGDRRHCEQPAALDLAGLALAAFADM